MCVHPTHWFCSRHLLPCRGRRLRRCRGKGIQDVRGRVRERRNRKRQVPVQLPNDHTTGVLRNRLRRDGRVHRIRKHRFVSQSGRCTIRPIVPRAGPSRDGPHQHEHVPGEVDRGPLFAKWATAGKRPCRAVAPRPPQHCLLQKATHRCVRVGERTCAGWSPPTPAPAVRRGACVRSPSMLLRRTLGGAAMATLAHSQVCGLRASLCAGIACVGCVRASGCPGQPWSSCPATSQPPSPPGQESLPRRTHLAVFAAVFAARERACDGRRLCALVTTAHTRTRHRAPPLALARACRQNWRRLQLGHKLPTWVGMPLGGPKLYPARREDYFFAPVCGCRVYVRQAIQSIAKPASFRGGHVAQSRAGHAGGCHAVQGLAEEADAATAPYKQAARCVPPRRTRGASSQVCGRTQLRVCCNSTYV